MKHSTSLNYYCKSCKKSSVVEIEVESLSDYYIIEYECSHCGKPILETDDMGKIVYNAVVDYYSGRADYLKDG